MTIRKVYSPSVGAAARLTIFTARQSGRLDIDNIGSWLVEAILEHAYAAPSWKTPSTSKWDVVKMNVILEHAYAAPSDNAFKHLHGMW